MSALEDLNLLSFIAERIRNGTTHRAIVQELRVAFPGMRGISVRSLKRFCAAHNLRATCRCSDRVLDVLVSYGIGIVSQVTIILYAIFLYGFSIH